jgi:hypothetical protein
MLWIRFSSLSSCSRRLILRIPGRDGAVRPSDQSTSCMQDAFSNDTPGMFQVPV